MPLFFRVASIKIPAPRVAALATGGPAKIPVVPVTVLGSDFHSLSSHHKSLGQTGSDPSAFKMDQALAMDRRNLSEGLPPESCIQPKIA